MSSYLQQKNRAIFAGLILISHAADAAERFSQRSITQPKKTISIPHALCLTYSLGRFVAGLDDIRIAGKNVLFNTIDPQKTPWLNITQSIVKTGLNGLLANICWNSLLY